MNREELIKPSEGTIIDVRTPMEYMGGSEFGAVNIPLNEIPPRLEELKAMKTPLILCCASGMSSGQAADFLIQEGLSCVNGGSWLEVNNLIVQNA